MKAVVARWFDALVLRRPWLPLVVLGVLALGAASQLSKFRLDANSDSLTIEHDPDRAVYTETREMFGSDDYVILAMAPADPWSPESLRRVDGLVAALEGLKEIEVPGLGRLPGIDRVLSPTRQRLFASLPDGTLAMKAVTDQYTVLSEGVDLGKARAELTGSALFGGNLVSREGDAFALIAYFADGRDRPLRAKVRELAADPSTSPADLASAEAAVHAVFDEEQARVRTLVATVRRVAAEHGAERFEVFASGIPSIVVDMVDAIEQDIVLFGVFAVGFMVLVLGLALRKPRWIALPMAAVLVVVVVVVAATVLSGKKTTVVTSNLSSLLLIVGMAHAIHIAVHSREVRREHPDAHTVDVVRLTLAGIAVPCLYACLTTAVGFASIAVSDIRPNIDFGLFMAAGTLFAYAVSFTLIPAGLALMAPERIDPPPSGDGRRRPMRALARWTLDHPGAIMVGAAVVLAVSVAGVARLKVETRFTDYFRAASPISRGLDFIDRRIGGTTPLEVTLRGDRPGYFLEEENFARVRAAHEALSRIPEAGTVLSLASLRIEGDKILKVAMPMLAANPPPLRNLVMMSENMLGKEQVRELVRDYVNDDYTVARLQVRIRETAPTLSRQELLANLRATLESDPVVAAAQPKVTGMFVLYTNMLRSLSSSQEQTLGMVVAALLVMLWVLFRDLRTALIGLVPNVLPILLVLGTMGWAGIPLDMMTIMIASVSMGMAVDATIHYTFRYRRERSQGVEPDEAVQRAHESIGRAIFFTALTVVGGFWVLVFSNFKPTIYFGMFTSLAMASALMASLVLLPVLLRRFGR